MLVSAMLFYKKLVKDLQACGFELNPYDPCVANKTVDGTQMIVSWHVDDLYVIHKSGMGNRDIRTIWRSQDYKGKAP
jgi:hypothetical protein